MIQVTRTLLPQEWILSTHSVSRNLHSRQEMQFTLRPYCNVALLDTKLVHKARAGLHTHYAIQPTNPLKVWEVDPAW